MGQEQLEEEYFHEVDSEESDDAKGQDASVTQDHENVVATKLKADPEQLKRNVLGYVASSNYDDAIRELQFFSKGKSEYPRFHAKAERYLLHCIDLINAIRAKKNFPGINSLTRSKVQELSEKTKAHFKELEQTLERIDRIQNTLKIEDVRSTLWFVKTLAYSALSIAAVALMLELANGIFASFSLVADDALGKFLNWLFKLF